MKKREIEVGKVYAAASPSRSRYSLNRAARVRVVAVGVHGIANGWKSEKPAYVLVVDESELGRTMAAGLHGTYSIEEGVSYRFTEIRPGNQKMGDYYREVLEKAGVEGWPGNLRALPYGWILAPWEEFEAEARDRLEAALAERKRAEAAKDAREEAAEALRAAGIESAHVRMGEVLVSTEDARRIARVLEAADEALPWLAVAHEKGAFKDCAAPLGGKRAAEKLTAAREKED